MKKNIIIFLLLVFFSITVKPQGNPQFIGADLIVYNAKITTQNLAQPSASAVAVKAGRIYAVGDDKEILELKSDKTKVIDAFGKRLIPGLNDAHIHVHMEGLKFNYSLRWDGVPSLKIALKMLSEQAKRTPKEQWVKVMGGWSPYQFKEKRLPTMKELNTAIPDNPFIIQYAYNLAFMNKLALDVVGVEKEGFWMPPHTTFEKDKNGNYTGKLFGDPGSIMFWIIESMVPQPSFDESMNSMQQLIRELNRFGITSVIDAGGVGYPEQHGVIQKLIKEDKLNIRFSFTDIGDANTGIPEIEEALNSITKKAPISPGQNLHPYLEHGYEYEGVGEAIRVSILDYENFDKPPHLIDTGHIYEVIIKDIGQLVKRRIPFRIHCTYNENLTIMLNALEDLNKKTPFDGLRWAIEHAEMISDENIDRIKQLGGGITLQDKMAFHGEGFIKTYGKKKASQTPPFRKLINSGIPLTLGTDGLRVSSFNPWISIAWAVTGKGVSGAQILADDNRLTRAEALKLYTIGSAWFQNDEDEKGRISAGQLADFVILNKDYFSVPEKEIKSIYSILTVMNGKVVYGSRNYVSLNPEILEVIPSWSPVKFYGGYYGND